MLSTKNKLLLITSLCSYITTTGCMESPKQPMTVGASGTDAVANYFATEFKNLCESSGEADEKAITAFNIIGRKATIAPAPILLDLAKKAIVSVQRYNQAWTNIFEGLVNSISDPAEFETAVRSFMTNQNVAGAKQHITLLKEFNPTLPLPRRTWYRINAGENLDNLTPRDFGILEFPTLSQHINNHPLNPTRTIIFELYKELAKKHYNVKK